jgi:hypothetical protein
MSAKTDETDFPGAKLEDIALDGPDIMSASIRFRNGKNLTLCALDGGGTIVVVSEDALHRVLVNESVAEVLERVESVAGARARAAGQH